MYNSVIQMDWRYYTDGYNIFYIEFNFFWYQVNFADIEPRKTQTVKTIPLRTSGDGHHNSQPFQASTPLRKAASVQNIKNSSQSLQRASSIDNLCRPTASSLQKKHTPTVNKTTAAVIKWVRLVYYLADVTCRPTCANPIMGTEDFVCSSLPWCSISSVL